MSDRSPVYLLAGDDDHLLHRELERLLDELREDTPQLDVEHVDASEAAGLPEMRTASLFGGDHVVVLRGAESLSGSLADEVGVWLDDPDPAAVLVLVAKGTGRIRSIATRAAKIGERRDAKSPAPWADREWEQLVRDEIARAGAQADAAAVEALLDHAGTSPTAIASKVGQVVAATPRNQRIDAEAVERVVQGHGNRGGFAVADAIARRDPAEAVIALRGSLESGEEPLALVGAITYRMRQLLQVKGGADAKEAGMSPGQHRFMSGLTRNFGPGELAWCHDRLARLDLDLKGSDLPGDLLMEVAVIELATAREVGAPWNPLAEVARPR